MPFPPVIRKAPATLAFPKDCAVKHLEFCQSDSGPLVSECTFNLHFLVMSEAEHFFFPGGAKATCLFLCVLVLFSAHSPVALPATVFSGFRCSLCTSGMNPLPVVAKMWRLSHCVLYLLLPLWWLSVLSDASGFHSTVGNVFLGAGFLRQCSSSFPYHLLTTDNRRTLYLCLSPQP